MFYFRVYRCVARFYVNGVAAYLFGEEETDSLEHLAWIERDDGQVEEDTVEHGARDVLQWRGQQQQW